MMYCICYLMMNVLENMCLEDGCGYLCFVRSSVFVLFSIVCGTGWLVLNIFVAIIYKFGYPPL